MRYTLFAIWLAVVTASDEECMGLINDDLNVNCCQEPIIAADPHANQTKLQTEIHRDCLNPTFTRCDTDTCIGRKRGYVTVNGTINHTALVEELQRQLEFAPKLFERVKASCLNIQKYRPRAKTPPPACVMQTINQCAQLQLFLNCTKWANDTKRLNCQKERGLVDLCNRIRGKKF